MVRSGRRVTSFLGGILLALPGNDPVHLPTSVLPEPLLVRRNHGPGTTGGGSTTISADPIGAGRFAVGLRAELTTYDHVDRSEAEAKALVADEFDSLRHAFLQTLSFAYGATEDLELGLQLGYYAGSGFIDAEADGMGGAESSVGSPSGLTDAWLTGKLRVRRGPGGHLAVVTGVKIPIGDDEEELASGERLEPSSQPGSGAFDGQLGLAYSRFLTERVTMDASGLYTLRGEHDDFRVGDRVDLGLALSYRLTDDVRAPNNWSVFGELQGLWLGKDEDDGVEAENSGGTAVYLHAGLRNRIDEHLSISVAPALPIHQDPNGEQVEVDGRIAVMLSWTP